MGGGGEAPVWCRDSGGSSNALPLWKKKEEKSSGFVLIEVDAQRVPMRRYGIQRCRDEDLEALARRPGSIICRPVG